ncbi:MAG TPA: DUF4214 domain-containing protein [Pirellulales bacterium]|nr:DUF4214 domain-containing protein [Pirellulales bacterium]
MRFIWLERCFPGRRLQPGRRQKRHRRGAVLAAPETLESRALLTAQLQVAQSGVVQNTVVDGQLLDDTYQVSNVGTNSATSVKFTDTLPAGVDFVAESTSLGTISESGGVVTAQLGTLAPGHTVTVDVQMTASGAGTLSNQVSVAASNATTETATSTTTATVASLGADLAVSGSSTPAQALPGNDLQYSFTVVNDSTTNSAPGALLTTQLPAGVVFLSAAVTGPTAGSASDDNGVLTASLGDLAPGENETVTIDVMPTVSGSLTASDFATDINGDGNLANNQQTENTTVNSTSGANTADLSVNTSSPGSLVVGQAGTYTITVTNNGANTASNLKLWEQIPAGVDYLQATTSQGGVQIHGAGDQFISANLGSLAQSASATITLVMTPTSTAAFSNQVEATTDSGLNDVSSAISTSNTLTPTTGSGAVHLEVTTTPSATSAYVGQALTYTITVTNQSSAIAHNVALTGPLPPAMTFVSAASASGTTSSGAATGTLSYLNGSVIDAIGNLDGGKSVTLTLVVTPNVATTLTNTSIATSDSGVTTSDNISQNTAVSGTLPPSTAADLVVTKTDSANGAAVSAGERLTYTITVKNQSAANSASNVVLSDMLPAAESYLSSSATLGTIGESNGLVTDDIGSLAPGQTETLQIVVDVTQNGTVSNTATATTDSGVVNPATISATDTSGTGTGGGGGGGGGSADLALTLAHATDNGALVPGQALTYTVTVTNTDASNTAAGVAIADPLPANVTFVSAASSIGSGSSATLAGSVSESGGSVTDDLGNLAAGQTATLTIVVMPTQAGTLSDSASVTSTTSDPNPANNSATDTASVAAVPASAATLAITNTAAPTTVAAGGIVKYTIAVTNSGGNSAGNVVVTELLPAGQHYTSGSSTVGAVTVTDGFVTADLDTLAGGSTATVTLFITPDVTGIVQSTAVVTTDSGVVNPSNSSAQASILVAGGGGGGGGEANLTVSNLPSSSNPLAGQELTYTVTVSNTGTGDADSVVISDALPAGVTLVSETTNRGTIEAGGGTVTADVGLLTSQQSVTITITVATTSAGTLSDTAVVTTTSPDSNSNPTATATVTVAGGGSGVVAYLPGQPGDGTDATFIGNVFRELLDRTPDAGGEAYWLSFLSAGSNPVLQQDFMVQAILGSNEYQTHFVEMVYENFLFRLADPNGLQFFVGQLAAGISEQLVMAEVITAPEYELRHGGSTKGFVDGLYQDILGRSFDPLGESFWVELLDSGQVAPYVAVDAFLGSTEAEQLLLNNSTGSALDDLTVGGWNQLYFQGNLTANAQDLFFNELASQTPYQTVIRNMLETGQYFDAGQTFLP